MNQILSRTATSQNHENKLNIATTTTRRHGNNGRSIKVAKENLFLEAPLVGNTEGREHSSSLKKTFVGKASPQTTLIPGVVFFSSVVMFDLDLGSLGQHTLVPFLPNSNNHKKNKKRLITQIQIPKLNQIKFLFQ